MSFGSAVEQEAEQEAGGLNGYRLMIDHQLIHGKKRTMINRLTGAKTTPSRRLTVQKRYRRL